MNFYEYQGKQLFVEYGLFVFKGFVVDIFEEVVEVCDKIGGSEWVVKVQVYVGGCGKVGGVKLVKSKEDVKVFVQQWLGKNLVIYQIDVNGQLVSKILVEFCIDIDKELYFGVVVDCFSCCIVFMVFIEGGVDIEKVVYDIFEKIFKVIIDLLVGVQLYQGCELVFQLGLKGDQIKQFIYIFVGLVKLFQDYDLVLLEVNLLVIKKDGNLYCLDVKINIDSNVLYCQLKLCVMYDLFQDDVCEVYVQKWELNYVVLEGNIGCMVNGVGLVMGIMDIVNLYGGKLVNFFDVGGGVIKECVIEVFKIILFDSNVKVVLVNIFGGIVCCDMIVEGIIGVVKEVGVKVLVVVCLEGNNVELGVKVLVESGLNIIVVISLIDVVQ